MGTGFSKKKKQAKKFQEQLMQMQSDLENLEVTGEAGNGLVKVTLGGDHEMKSIQIKPECVDPEDVEGMELLVKAAYQEALKQLQEKSSKGLPGGSFPDLSGLGF